VVFLYVTIHTEYRRQLHAVVVRVIERSDGCVLRCEGIVSSRICRRWLTRCVWKRQLCRWKRGVRRSSA